MPNSIEGGRKSPQGKSVTIFARGPVFIDNLDQVRQAAQDQELYKGNLVVSHTGDSIVSVPIPNKAETLH